MIYLINLLAIPLYYLLIRMQSTKKENATAVFFFVVFIHAMLFRALANPYNYQEDTFLYAEAFRTIREMSFYETVFSIHYYTHWGQLFLALNWLLGVFFSDPAILFVVVSVLTVGGTMWFYKKTSYALLTTVLLYLMYPMMYIMGFGVLRQHLSIAIILFALLYWNRPIVMFCLFICASLLHPSGLILLPFLLIRIIDFQKFKSYKLAIYTVILYIAFRAMIMFALPYFAKYQAIFNDGDASNNIVPVILIGSMVIMYYITGALKRINSERDKILFRYLVYGLIVSLFSIGVPVAGRLSLAFIYILPVTISHLYRYSERNKVALVKIYIVGVFLFTCMMIHIFNSGIDSKYHLYTFFWNA